MRIAQYTNYYKLSLDDDLLKRLDAVAHDTGWKKSEIIRCGTARFIKEVLASDIVTVLTTLRSGWVPPKELAQ